MAGKLTKKQLVFCEQVSHGVKPCRAAEVAGYAEPARTSWAMMRTPHLIDEIKKRRDSVIQGELAHVALTTMRDLMGDETPAATRYQASKWVLEHAGHANPADAERSQTKDLSDMNADELAEAVKSGMTALGELAQQLKGTHNIDGELRRVRELEVLDDDAEDADFTDVESDADSLDFME